MFMPNYDWEKNRALDVLRRARETAAAAAEAAAEAAALLQKDSKRRERFASGAWCNVPWRHAAEAVECFTRMVKKENQDPSSPFVNPAGPSASTNVSVPDQSTSEPKSDRKVLSYWKARKLERKRQAAKKLANCIARGVDPKFRHLSNKKLKSKIFWAKQKKFRSERRRQAALNAEAAGTSAAESDEFYYGPQETETDSLAYPPELYPEERHPESQEFEGYDWPGAQCGYPPPQVPTFEVYPTDRMQSTVEHHAGYADNAEHFGQAFVPLADSTYGANMGLGTPGGVGTYAIPAVPPQYWGAPSFPPGPRW